MNLKLIYQFIEKHQVAILLFVTIGFISLGINLGSFTLFWKVAGLDYRISTSLAYVLSVLFHFNANRHVAFKKQGKIAIKELKRYLALLFVNYLITLSIVYFVVEVLHLSPYLGILFAVGVNVNVSFTLLRFWVFPV